MCLAIFLLEILAPQYVQLVFSVNLAVADVLGVLGALDVDGVGVVVSPHVLLCLAKFDLE